MKLRPLGVGEALGSAVGHSHIPSLPPPAPGALGAHLVAEWSGLG
jgi:hypothetical protein